MQCHCSECLPHHSTTAPPAAKMPKNGGGARRWWLLAHDKMGGQQSRPDIAGYRVMRVELQSPASAASSSWVPYFDVLTQAGGVDLAANAAVLTTQLRAHIGRPLVLTVVNAKSRTEREITVRGAQGRRARSEGAGPLERLPPPSPQQPALTLSSLPFPALARDRWCPLRAGAARACWGCRCALTPWTRPARPRRARMRSGPCTWWAWRRAPPQRPRALRPTTTLSWARTTLPLQTWRR